MSNGRSAKAAAVSCLSARPANRRRCPMLEHKRVVELCIEVARKRVPVIAGAGSNNTKEAIELAQHAEKAGADAVLVVTPYYNKPTQQGLFAHFAAVAEAVKLPIIIYNIPARSVIDMTPETMGGLAKAYQEHRRRQGCHRQDRARVRAAHDLRQGIPPAFRRGRYGARLQRPWRRRLHLGDGQCRAAALRRVSGGDAWPAIIAKALRAAGPPDAAAQGDLHRARRVRREICACEARSHEPQCPLAAAVDRWNRRRKPRSTPPCAMPA